MSAPRGKSKKKQKRARFGRLFQFMVFATLAVAVTLGATVFFKVESIFVSGNSRYTPEQVIETTGIAAGDNLVRLRLGAIEANLVEQLPYIESVEVKRRFPSSVTVEVQELDAVAWVAHEDEGLLISEAGKILEKVPDSEKIKITGLELIVPKVGTQMAGAVEHSEKFKSLFALFGALSDSETMHLVTAVDCSASTQMVVRYDGRFDVKLMFGADYTHKLKALRAAVADRETFETGIMDLTHKDYDVLFSPCEIT